MYLLFKIFDNDLFNFMNIQHERKNIQFDIIKERIYKKDENGVEPFNLNIIFIISMELNSDVDIRSISNIDVKKAFDMSILYRIK